MENPTLIQHKESKIYYMDFSNLTSMKEITAIIEKSKAFIRNQPFHSVLTLTNLTNIHFNGEIKELFTAFVKGNKPYVKAGAVVGISGLLGIMYNSVMKLTGRNIKAINSLNEAKDWLVMNR